MPFKILIIDDDRILSSIYRNKFTAAGFTVDLAESGEAGLERLSKSVPDIVLLDLMLGDMNGVEVLQLLRRHEATKSLPVVVFSSAFMDNLMETAAKAGASKCLSKTTCPPHRIVDEIKTILAQVQARPTPILQPAAAAPFGAVRPAQSTSVATTPVAARATPPATPLTAAPSEPDISGAVRTDVLELISQRVEEAARTLPRWVNSATVPSAPFLGALYRCIHAITGSAGLAGRLRLGQLAGAVEALLKELKTTPSLVTASTLRTVSQAVELMPLIAHTSDSAEMEAYPSPLVAVIEPDTEIRRSICSALEKTQLRALELESSLITTTLATANRFDLMILSVEAAGLRGFELCTKIRATARNGETPIIFLVSHDDPEASATYTEAGATDYISQPLLPIELAVKGLVHLHKGRIKQGAAVN